MEQKQIDEYLNYLISVVYVETNHVLQRVTGAVSFAQRDDSLYIGKKLSIDEIDKISSLLKGHWKIQENLKVVTCHYFTTPNLKEDMRTYWLDLLLQK